jgi:hypothetical protein
VVAAALAMLLGLSVSGAGAAPPEPWLPDATLWCGDGLETEIAPGDWIATPAGSAVWIHAGVHAGQYTVVANEHYWLDGMHHEPVLDLSDALFLFGHSYGAKTGLQTRLDCQVVSRWVELGGTVIAPVTLARVR